MNKVIAIHLHGAAFQLEEAGYEVLRAYLDQAARQLASNPDQSEILADIEQAIGEKFRALVNASRNVVLAAEVKAVIAEMGPVDDGSASTSDSNSGSAPDTGTQGAHPGAGPSGPAKRLYRIYDGAVISGICTGLAAYLGADVVLIRLAAIVLACLSGGAVAIVYLVARFVIPVARTPEEKAAASGPSPTAQEFIRMAREGYYEGLKSIHDRDARREWKRKYHRRMRDWKRDFHWEMRENFGAWRYRWDPPSGSCRPPVGSILVLPILSTLKALLVFALWFAIFSLIATKSVCGLSLPAGLPIWAGVFLLLLAYHVVAAPIKALRRAYYYRSLSGPCLWHPIAELWHGLVALGVLALAVWFADRLVPGFHHALLALPGFLQHAAESVRHWWAGQ
jgi:phage shock protein PspC (stress-responsive transcriptional regulator)